MPTSRAMARRAPVVAGKEDHLHPKPPERLDGVGRVLLEGVCHSEKTGRLPVHGHAERVLPSLRAAPWCRNVAAAIPASARKRRCHENGAALDPSRHTFARSGSKFGPRIESPRSRAAATTRSPSGCSEPASTAAASASRSPPPLLRKARSR